MLIRRAAAALVLGAVAVIGAGAGVARLAAHASQIEGAGALAALGTLEEDVDARALEAAVRGGLVKGAHPLVAAQASWLLARYRS